MPIDQKVKDAVRSKLLTDLDQYFKDAEEMEDDVTLKGFDPAVRLNDFYRFSYSVKFERS